MNRFVKIGLLMVLVIALFGSYSFLKAQDEARMTPSVAPPVFNLEGNFPPPAVKHILEGTYINECDSSCSGTLVSGGYAPVDAVTTVTCPGTSGTCTIQADQDVQVSSVDAELAICLYVDGVMINGCYFTIGTDSSGRYVQNHTTQSVSGVAHGTHTVQTFQYSNNSGSFGFYSASYRVFKP
jgi:hypothetical protein